MNKPNGVAAGKEIMIVAGEASGDLHGANLVRAMQARDADLHFCGMGSRELAEAGVTILSDASKLAVVGITEVLSHLGDILRARRTLIARMRSRRPDLLILIDYPDFNLWLASAAKKMAIPVLYYISPQVWAWRSGRTRTIKRLTDRVAVILPFEQEYYAQRGCVVDFVGHPLLDSVQPELDPKAFFSRHHIDPARKLIGLIPGSRTKEIQTLLPDFLAAAGLLAADHPDRYTFLIPRASTIDQRILDQNGLAAWKHRLDVRVIDSRRHAMMAACDAAVASSGTVLLELAILGTPTVAAYRTSRHTYLLGRLLIRHLRYFSLVNLIGNRGIIPELLQDAVTPERIAEELSQLMENESKRTATLAGLAEVRQRLGSPGAAERTAAIAFAILASTHR
jgi:lipid-A-disaccharide synthase